MVRDGTWAPSSGSVESTSGPPGKSLMLYFFLKKKSFIYLLFIFGCAGSPLLCAGLFPPLVVVGRGYSSLWCLGFHCGGFSWCKAQALGRGFSGCSTRTLECGLSSCAAGA